MPVFSGGKQAMRRVKKLRCDAALRDADQIFPQVSLTLQAITFLPRLTGKTRLYC